MNHCSCNSNLNSNCAFSCSHGCGSPRPSSLHASSVHYEDPYQVEPAAPAFSLGDHVFWSRGNDALPCTIRWIGRIPQLCHGWSVGIEFEIAVQSGGDGCFGGRRYFSALPGHALFVPSEEITTQNSEASHFCRVNGCRSTYCCQDQDVGCGHANYCGDSTYGHYRHFHHFASCATRCTPQCGSHVCEGGPIYGRISVRQPLKNTDQPYESYYVHSAPEHSHSNSRTYSRVNVVKKNSVHAHEQVDMQRSSNANVQEIHPDNRISPSNLRYKESFFSPRSTIKFINGFREWVSCWVLGTSRRKRKQNLVIKGRRTFTSLVFADPSQSLSRTGKRLSSFGEYSSVEGSTLRKAVEYQKIQKRSAARDHASPASSDTKSGSTSVAQSTSSSAKIECKRKQYKKRPAPPPPCPPKAHSKSLQPPAENLPSASAGATNKTTHKSSRVERSSSIKTRRNRSNQNQIASSHSAQHGRSPKKRRAPPPPVQDLQPFKNPVQKTSKSNFISNGHGKHQVTIMQSESTSLSMSPERVSNFIDDIVENDGWVLLPHFDADNPSGEYNDSEHNSAGYGPLVGVQMNGTLSDGETEDINSRRQSISFSGDDDSENEAAGGILPYQQKKVSNAGPDLSAQAYKKNDKLLKISISKTETNVFTVEECNQSSCSSENDSDSSLSEVSDGDGDNSTDYFAISRKDDSPPDTSKTSSSDESLQPTESKPIFEELKLAPPSRTSVKDFVNAFNMLADRERHSDRGSSRTRTKPQPTKEHQEMSRNLNRAINKGNCIKSFPTKWQYQQNGFGHGAQKSRLLLPIEEESHDSSGCEIETAAGCKESKTAAQKKSEASFQESNVVHSKQNAKAATKVTQSPGNSAMSHNPKMPAFDAGNFQKTQGAKGDSGSTRVSDAAFNMLSGKAERASTPKGNGVKLKNPAKLGKESKKEEPIVVSLYIEDKSSHRGPIPFIVKPSMTLWKLKKKVEKEYKFDKGLQCWILGETFAIHDDASLASYGVLESGCPILLYVMSVESRTKSLPLKSKVKAHTSPIYDDVANSSSDSETENVQDHKMDRSHKNHKLLHAESKKDSAALMDSQQRHSSKESRPKASPLNSKPKAKSPYHAAWEKETAKKKDYHALLELDDVDLVKNVDVFECPVCFLEIEPGEGAVLQDCLHSFCRDCLSGAVEFSETAMVKCPFRNDEYSCESHLQEREIKSLVSPDVFERHLQRGMMLAESQAQNSFHCKTPDCHGWCLYEDNVNTFLCPVCKHTNCLTCAAVHEGKNCKQYQDEIANQCDSSEEAKQTKEYLEKMVQDGDAMKCPKCEVILMKKWGCDWLKCSMCHTEVCWVTKGPRWGPGGRGDTSGGCKCMLNGVRCHPKCSYCH